MVSASPLTPIHSSLSSSWTPFLFQSGLSVAPPPPPAAARHGVVSQSGAAHRGAPASRAPPLLPSRTLAPTPSPLQPAPPAPAPYYIAPQAAPPPPFTVQPPQPRPQPQPPPVAAYTTAAPGAYIPMALFPAQNVLLTPSLLMRATAPATPPALLPTLQPIIPPPPQFQPPPRPSWPVCSGVRRPNT